MAGRRKEQLAPSAALVASAVTFNGPGKVENVYRPMQAWQQEAWEYYDITPELRFASVWVANALSRCTLEPATLDDASKIVGTDDELIRAALMQLTGNSDGQSQLLYYLGLNLTVAGECYLVGRKVPPSVANAPDGQVWEVISVREISQSAGGWTIQSNVDNATITLGKDDSVIRIWRGHPAYRYQADSPVRALLPILSEIKFLTLHIYAQTISRLVGAGIMVLPKSVEIPGLDLGDGSKKGDGILKRLGEIMAKSISDPGSPAALLPMLMLVADEAVDKVREPLHFWSPFDEKAVESRKSAIGRFGTGFDLPPEVISGMSANLSSSGGRGTGLSHWGQWQIEEGAIKMHIEPVLDVIINALVLQFIRPITENPRAALLGNTNALKLQPDRGKEATEAYQVGALSDQGYRFYNGLSEDYAPQETDIKRHILWKMATGSAAPEMVLKAAEAFGVDLGLTIADVAGSVPAPQTPSPPSLEGHPQRGTPDRTASISLDKNAALLAVSESFVIRALERAGGRLRNSGVKPPDVPVHEVYQFTTVNGNAERLLEGAWVHLPTVCAGLCDPTKLTAALQSYCESLMQEKTPHTREALAKYLQLVD